MHAFLANYSSAPELTHISSQLWAKFFEEEGNRWWTGPFVFYFSKERFLEEICHSVLWSVGHIYNLLVCHWLLLFLHYFFHCWKRLFLLTVCLLLLSQLQNIIQATQILQLTSFLEKLQALNSHLWSSLLFILLLNHCFSLLIYFSCSEQSLSCISFGLLLLILVLYFPLNSFYPWHQPPRALFLQHSS